jgi:hypothetical protein
MDPVTLEASDLSDALRVWLRWRTEHPQVQATALLYELAAIVARICPTEAAAHQVLDHWVVMMKDQIRRLGVGVEHP